MLKPGFVLDGKYEIVSVIGQGGMSVVYLAKHQRLNQKWAVKEISRDYCENYEIIIRQLITEAEILKKLNHPGLPKIIDIIEKKDVVWMIMEFIDGRILKEVLNQRKRVAEEEVLAWGRQLCDVLSYLHTRTPPIIYRDLQPENVILKESGRLVLIDFGTAREYCYGKNYTDEMYLGTRGYAAPEQYGGKGQTDERTDIYCLGVMLYSLLTGYNPERPPYKIEPDKYWRENISHGTKKVISTCIQENPGKRYQNCKELSYALSQLDYEKHVILRQEKKKVKYLGILVLLLFLSGILNLGCRKITWFYKKKAVNIYIEAAERNADKKKAEQYYKQALFLIPDEKVIYQSLKKYFIHPNYFQVEDASALTSVVMTPCSGKPALDTLRKYKKKEYMEFCYDVGIGYFYDMGGITGKCTSEKWFRDVVTTSHEKVKNQSFDRKKKKRAVVYANIAGYYNTFLLNGIDKSGERRSEDFLDFYKQLCALNRFDVTEQSSESDISASYQVSREVVIEIINYADKFLEDKRISKEMLEKQLNKIRKRMGFFSGEKERMRELNQLLEDAENRLKIADGFKYKGDEGDEGGT